MVNGTEEKQDGVSYFRKQNSDGDVSVTYEMEAACDGRIYAYITAKEITQPAGVYVDGEFLCGYLNRSNWKILNLGEHKKGDKLMFTIQSGEDTLVIEDAFFATEDQTVLAEEYEKIMKTPVLLTRKSSSELIAETENTQDRILVFTIPYETDWKIRVDGKRAAPEEVYGTFLALPLKAGRHRIELSYIPKGLPAGGLISVVCAGILAVMLILETKGTFCRISGTGECVGKEKDIT